MMPPSFGHLGDADPSLDVASTVAQMDSIVAGLRDAWNQVNSKWALMLTQGQVDAADNRLSSLKGLINDLDAGGVARQHVFFPLDGQTSDQAWATWVDTANYVRDGLGQVGGFITNWSLSSVLPRIVNDVGNQVKKGTDWVLWVLGGLVALEALKVVGGFQGRGRGLFSGVSSRRRKKSRSRR